MLVGVLLGLQFASRFAGGEVAERKRVIALAHA